MTNEDGGKILVIQVTVKFVYCQSPAVSHNPKQLYIYVYMGEGRPCIVNAWVQCQLLLCLWTRDCTSVHTPTVHAGAWAYMQAVVWLCTCLLLTRRDTLQSTGLSLHRGTLPGDPPCVALLLIVHDLISMFNEKGQKHASYAVCVCILSRQWNGHAYVHDPICASTEVQAPAYQRGNRNSVPPGKVLVFPVQPPVGMKGKHIGYNRKLGQSTGTSSPSTSTPHACSLIN